MLDKQAFTSVPNCLDVVGRNLTIVMGHRLPYWKCNQISQLVPSYIQKKATGIPAPVDQNPPLPGKGHASSYFPVKPSMPASVVVEKAEGERLVAGKGRGNNQTVGPQSSESPTAKDTNIPVSKISDKGDASARYA